MRRAGSLLLLLAVASGAGAACAVFGSEDSASSPAVGPGSDSGDGDGGPDPVRGTPADASFTVDVVATEMCKALARCCYGTPTPGEGGADGGTFDVAGCIGKYRRVGFEGSNADDELRDGGKVVLDQVNAESCIKQIQGMSCSLPGAEFKAIRAACFGAYGGTVVAGGACAASIECRPGAFCKFAGDAGSGVCAALRRVNEPCGDSNLERADEVCSYRAGGSTGNYCKFADLGNAVVLDAGDWKCAAANPAASDCSTSLWCAQTVCSDTTSKCETPNTYFAAACSTFVE